MARKQEFDTRIKISVTYPQAEKLARLAEAMECSQAEVMRRLISAAKEA